MYSITQAIRRFFILLKYIFLPKSEPFVNLKTVFKHFMSGKFYPNKLYYDFTAEINVKEDNQFKWARYNSLNIAYPKSIASERIKLMLNAVLNEQMTEAGFVSPHLYLQNYNLKETAIIYDLGAAEGYQSKVWAQKVKTIVIFEPDEKYYNCLKATFEKEIEETKVILINEGLSNEKKTITQKNETFKLDTLDNLVKKYNLPKPTIIKADIEGEEINLLKGSIETLLSESMQKIEITTYHKPNDYIDIPKILSKYEGEGYFSEGIIAFNRIAYKTPGYINPASPVFRKCLYTFNFKK